MFRKFFIRILISLFLKLAFKYVVISAVAAGLAWFFLDILLNRPFVFISTWRTSYLVLIGFLLLDILFDFVFLVYCKIKYHVSWKTMFKALFIHKIKTTLPRKDWTQQTIEHEVHAYDMA